MNCPKCGGEMEYWRGPLPDEDRRRVFPKYSCRMCGHEEKVKAMKCDECGSEMTKAMDRLFRLWWVCGCGHEEKVKE